MDEIRHGRERLRVTYLPTERQRVWRGGCIQTGDSTVFDCRTTHLLGLKLVKNR